MVLETLEGGGEGGGVDDHEGREGGNPGDPNALAIQGTAVTASIG